MCSGSVSVSLEDHQQEQRSEKVRKARGVCMYMNSRRSLAPLKMEPPKSTRHFRRLGKQGIWTLPWTDILNPPNAHRGTLANYITCSKWLYWLQAASPMLILSVSKSSNIDFASMALEMDVGNCCSPKKRRARKCGHSFDNAED